MSLEPIKRRWSANLLTITYDDQSCPGDPARDRLGGTGGLDHAVVAFGAGVLGQGRETFTSSRRAGMKSSWRDSPSPIQCLGPPQQEQVFSAFGHIVRNADVGEVVQPGSPRGASVAVDSFAAAGDGVRPARTRW